MARRAAWLDHGPAEWTYRSTRRKTLPSKRRDEAPDITQGRDAGGRQAGPGQPAWRQRRGDSPLCKSVVVGDIPSAQPALERSGTTPETQTAHRLGLDRAKATRPNQEREGGTGHEHQFPRCTADKLAVPATREHSAAVSWFHSTSHNIRPARGGARDPPKINRRRVLAPDAWLSCRCSQKSSPRLIRDERLGHWGR